LLPFGVILSPVPTFVYALDGLYRVQIRAVKRFVLFDDRQTDGLAVANEGTDDRFKLLAFGHGRPPNNPIIAPRMSMAKDIMTRRKRNSGI
jgi:hypothetical protein